MRYRNILLLIIAPVTNAVAKVVEKSETNCNKMFKVKGTLEDAHNSLTVGQYSAARKELFAALGLSPESRTAFGLYLSGTRPLKYEQFLACRAVFQKYGIDWTPGERPHTTIHSKVLA